MLGLCAYNCIIIVLIFSWIIIYIISSLKKRKKAKAKLKTSSFAHLYIPKVYFNFTIYRFNLHIIIIIKHI